MKSFGIFFWLLVLCLSVPPSSLAAQSGKDYIVWVTNPLDPVSKTRKPLGISQYQLHSARGESEGYHLVITAAADDLKVEKISVSDLKSSDQIISDDFVRIYKEHYLGIFKRGPFAHLKKGEYPGALIPLIKPASGKPVTHGSLRPLPLTIKKGENQPFYVEVTVPVEAIPGEYRGEIMIRFRGNKVYRHKVKLKVRNFALPKVPATRSSYGAVLPLVKAKATGYRMYTVDYSLK